MGKVQFFLWIRLIVFSSEDSTMISKGAASLVFEDDLRTPWIIGIF